MMNIRRIIATVAMSVCIIQTYAQIYVSAAAMDDNRTGTSWETAKQTIAAGLSAVGAGGTVFVAAGEYPITAELVIPSGVTVKGGYVPGFMGTDTSQRHLPGANSHWSNTSWCTIITGAGNHRIATVRGLLDGCVLKNGCTNTHGGGALVDGGTVRYCVLKDCDAINDDDGVAEGGGAYVQNNGTLLNCVVTGCRGDKGAGVAGGNGNLISNTITRNSPIDCGIVADYDGNIYKTLVIGNQCWMRENLRTTHFADGVAIPTGSYSSSNPYRYEGYTSDLSNGVLEHCGYLYNWPAVMHGASSSNADPSGVQGICPTGWHVPSNAEWTRMADYIKTVSKNQCDNNGNNIAKSLSSKLYWNSYTGSCVVGKMPETNNASRFSAYPTGYSSYGSYYSFGYTAAFWTATENYSSAYLRYLDADKAEFNSRTWEKLYGCSVRCVKNE